MAGFSYHFRPYFLVYQFHRVSLFLFVAFCGGPGNRQGPNMVHNVRTPAAGQQKGAEKDLRREAGGRSFRGRKSFLFIQSCSLAPPPPFGIASWQMLTKARRLAPQDEGRNAEYILEDNMLLARHLAACWPIFLAETAANSGRIFLAAISATITTS